MKRDTPLPGGRLEYRVLAALWDLGSASARDIHERVGEPGGLVYTTTAKVLDRLYAKGLVSRERAGKAFVYCPTKPRSVIESARATKNLREILGSTPRPAVATLVEAVESIDPELLDELARVVAMKRRARGGS
jgi:BlaI family transcriptional regulator, penicillinase repressor